MINILTKIKLIKPLISIIIPSLNNLKLLKRCILSIKFQTYSNIEVWIIDGGSIDGTKEYLETLSTPFNIVLEKDNGIYDAMNKGISKSQGDWLYFLGADDYFYSLDVLEILFKSTTNSKVDILLSKVKYELKKDSSYFISKNGGVFYPKWTNLLWLKNTVNHQAIIYNKRVFKEDIYSLDYKILSDYYFNLKLFKRGINYKLTNSILSICGGNGISKQYNWSLYKEELALKVKLSSILLKPIFFLLILLKYFFKKGF